MQTHELDFDGDVLTKRYTGWSRGEHEREWLVLQRLHTHNPDLVPVPLAHGLASDPPWISMSRLPGAPMLGKLTPPQTAALTKALRELWSAPATDLPLRRYHTHECLGELRGWFAAAHRPGGVSGEAFDATVTFLESASPPPPGPPILGHSDPNLANYLWDGHRTRIVDFEDAGVSDVEFELATLAEHLSSRDSTNWAEFTDQFNPDPARLLFGRKLMAALWLYFLLPGRPAARRNPPGTREWQATRTLGLYA
jgi:aminoglycoside phosphotransferase (APT) family kinase protein